MTRFREYALSQGQPSVEIAPALGTSIALGSRLAVSTQLAEFHQTCTNLLAAAFALVHGLEGRYEPKDILAHVREQQEGS